MSSNPLIQDLVENEAFPSVSVALPTGGRWYEKDMLTPEADSMDLPVGVLGILAEQSYRDPWLLLAGESIPRMLKTVCPAVLKANDLCEIDLETILLAARLVSYGPTIELTHACDNRVERTEEDDKDDKDDAEKPTHKICGHQNRINIDINEHILRYAVIDDAVVEERFTYHLKRVDQKVHLRPIPYERVIAQIKENIARDKKLNSFNDIEVEELITNSDISRRYTQIIDMTSETALENIEASIHAVSATDGQMVNGKDFIREWLLALPTDEAQGITNKINELTAWFISFSEIKYTCGECEQEGTFRLELDANRLFGPAGDSPQPKKPSRKSKSGAKRRKIR